MRFSIKNLESFENPETIMHKLKYIPGIIYKKEFDIVVENL